MKKETPKHSVSIEKLVHFQCGACKKWWSIGDAPGAKKSWFCPWCGMASTARSKKPL